MKKIAFYLALSISSVTVFGQSINWISPEKAFALQKEIPKPILLDVYTDWCGWCKHMDATTYKDPQIISYLNQNFYAVKFNAESKAPVIIGKDTLVNPNPNSGRSPHQFTSNMGINSYPTTVFFDEKGNNPTVAAGALKAEEMAPLLIFFAEKLSNVIDVNSFSQDFKRTFNPSADQLSSGPKIKWHNINEGLALAKKTKKKIWIQTFTESCATCKIMDSTIYQNTFLANYLNQNYVLIKFDAFSKDTVNLQSKKFVSSNPNEVFSYHQLILGSMNNQELKIPAVLIFDENEQMLAPVPSYLNLKYAEALAVYFKEGKNLQNLSFNDFVASYQFKSITSN